MYIKYLLWVYPYQKRGSATLSLPYICIRIFGHFCIGARYKKLSLQRDKYFREATFGNLWLCAVNDEILNNVKNISRDFQYLLWPVNGEPSNTFGTLELLFPISKEVRSRFIPKRIVLVTFQKASLIKSLFILIKQYLFTCYCARNCFSWLLPSFHLHYNTTKTIVSAPARALDLL